MRDVRQTSDYADYMSRLGWEIDKINDVYCYSKKIPILGSLIKIQRGREVINKRDLTTLINKQPRVKLTPRFSRKSSKSLFTAPLRRRLNKRRTFIVLIEPLNKKHEDYYIKELGFKKIKSSSLPSKTVHIDLKKSEKKLLSEMHYKTRYNIKLSKKRGVSAKLSPDIEKFAEFWQMSAKKRGMFLSLIKHIETIYRSFGRNAKIFLAFRKNELLGGVLTISTKDICYYMYAASTDDGNKFFAPTLLAWEAIKYAEKSGKKIFDFEGIYDERYPLKNWKGFSRFKKSFGGKQVEFPLSLRRYSLPI